MMNQTEATDYLLNDLPELPRFFPRRNRKIPVSIYDAVQAFVTLTCVNISSRNYKAGKQCFALADKLYEQGNNAVRCAIENVFVFSLDHIFSQAGRESPEIRGLVPGSLYSLYIRQVTHGGC